MAEILCIFGILNYIIVTYLMFGVVFFSDYLFKLLLIGDSGVGKSCLLLRFAVSLFILLIGC